MQIPCVTRFMHVPEHPRIQFGQNFGMGWIIHQIRQFAAVRILVE